MEIPIMAYFAELNENNIVLRVISVSNEITTQNSEEQEQLGINFCQNLFGGIWLQTSFNGRIRKNYAGPGFVYDANRDAFIPPKPQGDGWVLNEETCLWSNPEREAAQRTIEMGVTYV
jgi:hypothetical protein